MHRFAVSTRRHGTRMGFEKDLARPAVSVASRAQRYLLAMAKMSWSSSRRRTLRATSGAAVFSLLKERSPDDRAYSDSFAASIISAALKGFPDSEQAALNDSVGLMIRQYDARIRAGSERLALAMAANPFKEARPRKRRLQPNQGRPGSGMAEFYVAFDAKGQVDRLWLLDAWPDKKLARTLRPTAMDYEVTPEAMVKSGAAIGLLPVVYGDQRTRIRKQE